MGAVKKLLKPAFGLISSSLLTNLAFLKLLANV